MRNSIGFKRGSLAQQAGLLGDGHALAAAGRGRGGEGKERGGPRVCTAGGPCVRYGIQLGGRQGECGRRGASRWCQGRGCHHPHACLARHGSLTLRLNQHCEAAVVVAVYRYLQRCTASACKHTRSPVYTRHHLRLPCRPIPSTAPRPAAAAAVGHSPMHSTPHSPHHLGVPRPHQVLDGEVDGGAVQVRDLGGKRAWAGWGIWDCWG